MSDIAKALATQVANIEKRTGKSPDQLSAIVRRSGLSKHGEIRAMLKRDLGMEHGDANSLVHHVLQSRGPGPTGGAGSAGDDVVAGLYLGAKAGLRPIYDKLMAKISASGEMEIAPKKTYVSLRRKKQFATIGPATNTRVEVGLKMKDVPATERLVAMPPASMCN